MALQLYKKFKYGDPDLTQTSNSLFGDQPGFSQAAGVAGAIGSGVVDAIGNKYPNGAPKVGSSIASGALKGASMGAVAGPWGAAAGAVVGAGLGLIQGKKNKRDYLTEQFRIDTQKKIVDNQMTQAQLAADPELMTGYKNGSYFEDGGVMIKPSHRGKFTDWAKSHDMSVGEATSKVLANKDDYPEGVRKMAQFSRNFGGHKNGGMLYQAFASGGVLEAPMTEQPMTGGTADSLNSNSVEFNGRTHADGGILLPEFQSEVEDGETTKGNFVFSKELGFADKHKPIAKAIGKIEKKPESIAKQNSLRLLKARENKLALMQEFYKSQTGLSNANQ